MATTGTLASLSWAAVGASPTYVAIPAVGTCTWSLNRPALEITALGDANSSFLAGVQTTTATFDLYYDNDDGNHKEMFDNINGAEAALLFRITLESGETLTGTGQVTNFDIVATAGDVTRATLQIQFSGAITNASS